mmetsp:Transcript_18924/g.28793  ORF Transcript_18924/g.28793 Transcript_18924/m.28793 type:complete len:225 (+) Transcript_18924:154-828(+)
MKRILFILQLCLFSVLSAAFVTKTKAGTKSNAINSTQNGRFEVSFFTGGAFDGKEVEAARVASRIKSVKDLGWTTPPKRKGSTRPRHRAYGGEEEDPIQLKPNYDASNPNCVEKWLTQEEFEAKFGVSGPVADTIFVALASGAAFAERDVCEKVIVEWKKDGSLFDEIAFLRSVQRGRTQLAIGWLIFGSAVTFAGSGILFPTNPAMKAFELLVAELQGVLASS